MQRLALPLRSAVLCPYVCMFLLLAPGTAWSARKEADPAREPPYESQLEFDSWRYTRRGWERLPSKRPHGRPATSSLPAITGVHPLVVGGLQILLSLAAFLALETRRHAHPSFNGKPTIV